MPRNWRTIWLLGLAALFVAQTGLRLFFHSRLHTPVLGLGLHIFTLAAWLSLVALLVAHLPERRRPVATALLLGASHAFLSLFDAVQMAWHYLVGTGAPVWLVFTDPGLTFSLLASIGITPIRFALILAALLALHVALYAPVAARLTAIAGRIARVELRPRISAVAVLLALFVIATFALPRWMWRREVFRNASSHPFQMAPVELMTGGKPVYGPASRVEPLPGARPLVLIVVDALRRDRMGVYDPRLATTPFLSRAAATPGWHVERSSWSTCTFSFCGIMSILASRSWNDFGSAPPTMIDALSRHGYRSYLLLGGSTRTFGRLPLLFGRGVAMLWDIGIQGASDDRVLLAKLRETDFPDPRHSFVYLHLMSTHAGGILHAPAGADYPHTYDAKVRQADAMIEQALAILAAKGFGDALVVITADHGERLGEKGRWFHGGPPDDAALMIPLIVRDGAPAWPGRALASQIDIAPTFLRGVGGQFGAGWRGTPLQEPARVDAVPIGTAEATGAIATLGGKTWKYLCDRDTGRERVTPRDGAPLTELRRLHREVASPIREPGCRR